MKLFRPKRLPLADKDLDARIRQIEDHLTSLGGSPVNPSVVQQAASFGQHAAASAGQSGGGGGGGGGGSVPSPVVLNGDVVGPANNNTVQSLQTITLTITSPVTGDVITYNGTAIVNSKTINGAITITGALTAQAALVHTGATAGFLGAAAVAQQAGTTDLRVVLINFGFLATGGATPLDLNGGAFKAATGQFSGALSGLQTPLQLKRRAIVMGADADITPTNVQYDGLTLEITSSVTLTATRKVILPLTDGGTWLVSNQTTGGQILNFIGATGTGVTVANGKSAFIRTDGTNIIRATADV